MDYRLLVELEAIALLDSLSTKVRRRHLDHFVKLSSAPEQYADYHPHDSVGRRIEISILAGYSIHYWIDAADRHSKILTIRAADR